MKKLLLFLLLAFPLLSWADDSGQTGACTYTFVQSTGTLTISGKGSMDGYYGRTSSRPWDSYKSSIKTLVIKSGVTYIGSLAFSDCSGLTSITIPSSVTQIDQYAFSGCTGLKSVTIPQGVTIIGKSAFSGCTGLKSVTIPSSVTYIMEEAFGRCYKLTSVIIPHGVTDIRNDVFCYCSGLTSITIPSSLTNIGSKLFIGCSSLSSIIIDNSNPVYNDGNGSNCVIKSKTNTLLFGCNNTIIPEGVSHIEEFAFSGSGLTSITLPSSVTSIGEHAFHGCSGLRTVFSYIKKPFALGSNAFDEISSDCTLYVPLGTRNAYISNGWTEDVFKGGVVEMIMTNADFETDDASNPIGIRTFSRDVTGNLTAHLQDVTGWKITENGDGCAGGTYVYGTSSYLGESQFPVPDHGLMANEMKALGIVSSWGQAARYTQDVVLDAGKYLLQVAVYNSAGTNAIAKNLIGVAGVYASTKKYPVGEWTIENLEFELKKDQTITVSLGYTPQNVESKYMPHLFIEYAKIFCGDEDIRVAKSEGYSAVKAFQNTLYFYSKSSTTPITYSLDELDKITFSNSGIQMHKVSGKNEIAFSDFHLFTFSEIDNYNITAIETVSTQQDDFVHCEVNDKTLFIRSEQMLDDVIIYDIQGRAVARTTSPSSSFSMSLDYAPAGVYIVKIMCGNKSFVKKIVI